MKKILVLVIIGIALFGCSSNKLTPDMPVEKKMEIGDNLFQKGKYNKAIPYYTDVAFERNSIYTSEAQLKLADCYFEMNKFTEARFEYEEMIRLFPDDEKVDHAYFRIGVCYFSESLPNHYSQKDTENAISAFETFIEKFPFDKKKPKAIEYIRDGQYKILEKKYNNGYTYYKMFDYSAALMYFDEIIDLGNTNELDRLSLYYSFRIFHKRENMNKAADIAAKLIEKYPGSKEAEKVKKSISE